MREREPQLLAAELQPVQRVVRERVSARGGRAGGADALAQRRAERSVELPHDARAERLAPFPVERATDAADVHRDTHERADLLIRHQRQTPREELVQSAVELPVAVQSTLPSPPTEQAAACLTGGTRSLFRPDVSSAPSAGFRQSRSWSRTSRRSAWTMIRASSLSRTVGVQPSRSRAFVASPTSTSTSAGRKNFSETRTTTPRSSLTPTSRIASERLSAGPLGFSISQWIGISARENASSANSRTECVSPVEST